MTTRSDLIEYCTGLPGASETFPFGDDVAVFKVGGKMFALVSLDESQPPRFTVKCDVDRAIELRARWPAVEAGYHIDKRHWNTVTLDGSVPHDELIAMVDDSYALVVASLPARARP